MAKSAPIKVHSAALPSLFFICCSIFGSPARAQDRQRYEISAGYSYRRADTSVGPFNMNGIDATATRNMNSWLGIEADVGGYHTEGFREETYLSGLRVSTRLRGKSSVFGNVLVGGVHANAGGRGLPSYSNGFATAIGGGVDYSLTKTIAIRLVQADYLQTRLGQSAQNNVRVTIGVAFRFGNP